MGLVLRVFTAVIPFRFLLNYLSKTRPEPSPLPPWARFLRRGAGKRRFSAPKRVPGPLGHGPRATGCRCRAGAAGAGPVLPGRCCRAAGPVPGCQAESSKRRALPAAASSSGGAGSGRRTFPPGVQAARAAVIHWIARQAKKSPGTKAGASGRGSRTRRRAIRSRP